MALAGIAGWWLWREPSDGEWGKVIVRPRPADARQATRSDPANPKAVNLDAASLPWRAVSGPEAFAARVDLPNGNTPWTVADLAAGMSTTADNPVPIFTTAATLPTWPRVAKAFGTGDTAAVATTPVRTPLSLSADEEEERKESGRLMQVREARLNPSPDAQQLATRLALPELPRFLTALASGPDGSIWIGTEGEGVFRYDPATQALRQFTTKDGLGDDNGYAVAVDRQGRIWVGHLNHGVSVYDGSARDGWRCYEIIGGLSRPASLDGPIGERVFAIKVCPTDGDVWIATNCGLARYSETRQTWSYYTGANGLPSNEVSSIAFDAVGNVYLGMQCEGVVMADAADQYAHWRVVRGPTALPTTPTGQGLPTGRINDVLVTQNDTVYAATCAGLAWSNDHGVTWRYTRGKEWAEKVRQSEAGPPAGWIESPGAAMAEDFCTVLAEDVGRQVLWVGHQDKPIETIDLTETTSPIPQPLGEPRYVTALLAPSGPVGQATVAAYGEWKSALWRPPAVGAARPELVAPRTPVVATTKSFPVPARPPTESELLAVQQELSDRDRPADRRPDRPVMLLPDDWRTRGEWLGRYGRYWACLCAMDEHDYVWGATPQPLAYLPQIGPHHSNSDYIRYWRHLNYADTPPSLEIPCVYMDSRVKRGLTTWAKNRRQSDWDDHGEVYPFTFEGPDIYCTLNVPQGDFQLSLYLFNKDQHVLGSPFRYRDHTVSIYTRPAGSPLDFVKSTAESNLPSPAAQARVRQYWGGVYKRFAVHGPCVLTVKVARDYSHNTILTAVMLDTFEQRPAPFGGPDKTPAETQLSPTFLKSEEKTFDFTDDVKYRTFRQRSLLSRTTSRKDDETLVASLMSGRFRLWQFAAWEKSQSDAGVKPMRDVERELRWDGLRKKTKGEGYDIISEHLSRQPMTMPDRLK